jgi:hypothetical protein
LLLSDDVIFHFVRGIVEMPEALYIK